jgi:eukaryotic-like serine/threonine-protein kinase
VSAIRTVYVYRSMTTPFKVRAESWPRVSALLDQALELDAAERAKFLDALRESEPDIAAEVSGMLPDVSAAVGAAEQASQTSAAAIQATPYATLLSEALLAADGELSSASAGMRFGAWTLVEKLGRGGMGEVWRAERSDGMYEGAAAIKLLRTDLPVARLAARFARERAVLARLNHPNIARLLDAGVANEQAFIVLELVNGTPLLDYAAKHAPTLAARVRLVRDIARAVEHAHSQLVLHRDLKPSNVLVDTDGTVKLLDFGIAAALDEASNDAASSNLTQLTGRGLTLEYASPEQIVGDRSVPASDVYSLGVMLFHLVAGQRPFATSANRAALEYAIVHDDAPRASNDMSATTATLPESDRVTRPIDASNARGDLDAIIAKALRKSSLERYGSAAAFANDLDQWLIRAPISIKAEDRGYRTRLWFRRNWIAASFGAVAATAVVVGLAVSLWQRSEAVHAAALAKEEAARAEKVASYLGELIESASPDQHAGNWPTVLTLLEKSEKELDERFKDDPRTHALLLKRMTDTNDALNRDTVALAQSQRLISLHEANPPSDPTVYVDALRQQAWLLYRLVRHQESLAVYEKLKPKLIAAYGKDHAEYAKYLLGLGGVLKELGRPDETLALYEEGYALLMRHEPDNPLHRLNLANDKTVLFTRDARFHEAEQALSAVQSTFAEVEKSNGAALRDVLIMRNNLEAIRIRIGRYDGVDVRLNEISNAGTKLLGADNFIALTAASSLASHSCATANFTDCLHRSQRYAESVKKRVGGEPSEIIAAELDAVSLAALFEQQPKTVLRDSAKQLFDRIAATLTTAGVQRSFLYRSVADAAIRIGDFSLARVAIEKARQDLHESKASRPDRAAQADRAEAALAFHSGDARRAVTLLDARFKHHELVKERDTPAHATLWLQRALYEVEFDSTAAAKSLAESRAAFARAGGAMPHFAALTRYVDARLSGEGMAIKNAQIDIDRIYLRGPTKAGTSEWRLPHLTSQ